ncbi:hypothetical protein BgiBS90_028593 [Biomphalaria glabrata]|nr:hypothetical protein BgiBS90_028593 [Biomphalaria glabrata]
MLAINSCTNQTQTHSYYTGHHNLVVLRASQHRGAQGITTSWCSGHHNLVVLGRSQPLEVLRHPTVLLLKKDVDAQPTFLRVPLVEARHAKLSVTI